MGKLNEALSHQNPPVTTLVYHPKQPTRNSLALIFMRAACDTE